MKLRSIFGKDKVLNVTGLFFLKNQKEINVFQPLCDGNHLRYYIPTNLRPVRFIPDKDMEVNF